MLEHGTRSGTRGAGHAGADGVVVRRDQDIGHLLYQYYVDSFRLNAELETRATEQQPPINQLRRSALEQLEELQAKGHRIETS